MSVFTLTIRLTVLLLGLAFYVLLISIKKHFGFIVTILYSCELFYSLYSLFRIEFRIKNNNNKVFASRIEWFFDRLVKSNYLQL